MRTRTRTSSGSWRLGWLVSMVLLVVVFATLTEAVGQMLNPAYAPAQRKRLIKAFFERKDAECREECGNTTEEINDCLGNCISLKCYAEHFLNYELEEGEVDLRYVHFRDCAAAEAQRAWKAEKDGA